MLSRNRAVLDAATAAVLAIVLSSTINSQQRATELANEPACQTLVPAAAGGPAPRDASTLVIRWLGASNHEFAYRTNVVLMNAYYDRASRTRPIGVHRDDLKRVDVIFVGHGHADHMADAPYIAQRTGARLVGGPPTVEHALKLGFPERQAVTVRGGEVQKFNGFTVQAILAIHADTSGVAQGRDAISPGLGRRKSSWASSLSEGNREARHARGRAAGIRGTIMFSSFSPRPG